MRKICVIGGANVDICGASLEPLRRFDSNPGEIAISYGGVGRNIAQIIALLGGQVSLMTCFSDDGYGRLMKKDCEGLGIDVSGSVVTDRWPSSMYLAILDNDHDMRVAMSDMRILREMTPEKLDPLLQSLHKDDMIIIDANLDMECIAYVLDHAPCPAAADPVSTVKAERLKDRLDRLSIFKPNRYEAEALSGIEIRDEKTACQNLDFFLEKGIGEVVISLADHGILAATREKKSWFTHKLVLVENATGGGDVFLGAYCLMRLDGKPPEEAVRFGISAAVTTIENDAVRRRSLSREAVLREMGRMEIKERIL